MNKLIIFVILLVSCSATPKFHASQKVYVIGFYSKCKGIVKAYSANGFGNLFYKVKLDCPHLESYIEDVFPESALREVSDES